MKQTNTLGRLGQMLSGTDDVVLDISHVIHKPGAACGRTGRRTSIGHAHVIAAGWCPDCFPGGEPR